MPNWAEGNIRIRGKRQNIITFLQEELKALYEIRQDTENGVYSYGYEERPLEIESTAGGYELMLRKSPETLSEVYFCGSNRQFIDFEGKQELLAEISDDHMHQRDDQVLFLDGFQGAWGEDGEYFSEKAVEHKVDIRIFTWERGMQWSNVVTCYRDGKYTSELKTYRDWMWESALPNYGG